MKEAKLDFLKGQLRLIGRGRSFRSYYSSSLKGLDKGNGGKNWCIGGLLGETIQRRRYLGCRISSSVRYRAKRIVTYEYLIFGLGN